VYGTGSRHRWSVEQFMYLVHEPVSQSIGCSPDRGVAIRVK
jgi:hypothetical protein